MAFFSIARLNFRSTEGIAPSKKTRAFPAQKKVSAPVRKPACVMHPENTPRTIYDSGFPKDFSLYEYAGAMLTVLGIKRGDSSVVRRPALIAKMVRKYQVGEGGASVEVEMTASVNDLKRGKHPHADAIAAALTMYYEEKVLQKEAVVKTRTQAPVASAVSGFPANNFYAKVDFSANIETRAN
jgi:hypothetical protein